MSRLELPCVLAAVAAMAAWAPVHGQTIDELIAQAVRPLPAELQAKATVYRYDDVDGKRIVLRQGTNHVECQPRNPATGFTRCFPAADGARRDLAAALTAQGQSAAQVAAALAEAEAQGRIAPAPFGALRYRLYEEGDRIQLLWIVSLPNATAEQLGMPTASQRDDSLAGRGRPWMMREGTPQAHLMIPINGTELSNPGGSETRLDTRSIDADVAQALLPLPRDLREGATVVTYDERTGARRVLRQGSNAIECQPRNPDTGFTRCYHRLLGAEQDLRAALRADDKTDAEIESAVAAARTAGSISAAPFGSLAYRLYENDDRLKLLWVLRLPNATSTELGMPTASQRDSALAGRGLPWMMREGTPQAHLMIPINSTELSN